MLDKGGTASPTSLRHALSSTPAGGFQTRFWEVVRVESRLEAKGIAHVGDALGAPAAAAKLSGRAPVEVKTEGRLEVNGNVHVEVGIGTPAAASKLAASSTASFLELSAVVPTGAGSEDPDTTPGASPPASQRRGHEGSPILWSGLWHLMQTCLPLGHLPAFNLLLQPARLKE